MSLANPRKLDELLNYRLAHLLSLSSAPGIRLFEGGYGVSRREWRLVGTVAEGGAMSPSELAERAQLERPHVSRAITALVGRGLLVRTELPGDRRRARVEITPQGLKLYEEVFPKVAGINAALLRSLTPDQLTAFEHTLGVLTKSAQEVGRVSHMTLKAARHLGGRRRAAG